MSSPENKSAENEIEGGEIIRPTDFDRWIHPPLEECCFLTGPTSSGKTTAALELAERLDAEIVSLDSMAIYRGMDIGTAKPSAEQQARVPHHMIDIVDPTENYSVSSYAIRVHAVVDEIRARGKKVLVCGGTPLYLKSLLRGLFLGPPADWAFRNAVEAELKEHGEDALLERLRQVDPILAHKLHPNDHRRMIRALEVARATGVPLSHWQQQFDRPAPPERARVAVLRLDRAWLHERINARVEAMLAEGLEQEVRQLLVKHGELGRTAAQAVGYREVLEMIEGKHSLEETCEHIKAHTRQFARRQEIWFRGLDELNPVTVTPEMRTDDLVAQVLGIFEQVES